MNSLQKIMQLSNWYYNQGLECAQVHSISSAIENLKKSLHYYKNNIEARNLLGLCYYEVGESVMALREWVISENLKAEENPASTYIKDIQPELSRTGKLNVCIKKYNQALEYANNGSEDLAVIQLKKVISTNPKFIRAHLLLALIYLHMEEYVQAKDVLRKAGKVDANNTMVLRYLKEANEHLHSNGKKGRKKNVAEDSVAYTSGNATIIRPAYFKDNATIGTIVNIVFGLVVGFLISFFLVVPGVKRQAAADSAAKLVEANNTISTKNVTIKSYQTQVDELTKQMEEMENNSSQTESAMSFYQEMLKAYVAYNDGDYETAGEAIAKVDEKDVDREFKDVFLTLKDQVNEKYLRLLYREACDKYNQALYEDAIEIFEKILKADEEYSDGDAMYYCAQAYRLNGDNQKASMLYQKIVDKYPDTYKATNARKYLEQLTNQ
ncbi:MAG: tetratricopeptide repeat protein [Lachnospiraceae bacterium]